MNLAPVAAVAVAALTSLQFISPTLLAGCTPDFWQDAVEYRQVIKCFEEDPSCLSPKIQRHEVRQDTQCQKSIDDLKRENARLKTETTKLLKANQTKKTKKSKSKTKKTKTKKTKTKKTSRLAVEQENGNLKSKITEENGNLKSKITGLEKETLNLKSKITGLEKENENLNKENIDLNQNRLNDNFSKLKTKHNLDEEYFELNEKLNEKLDAGFDAGFGFNGY